MDGKMTPIGLWCIAVFMPLGSVSADVYTVTISLDDVRLAHVQATVEPDDGLITMNDEANQGLERGWSTFVEKLSVTDKDGQPVELTYEPTSRWRLKGRVTGPVTLTYDVRLGHDKARLNFGDNGAAYANDSGVMWSGRALFIAGRSTLDVEVRFIVPEAWKVTTPWTAEENQPKTFITRGTDDLVNSAFFAGTHTSFDLPVGAASIRFALAGETVVAMRSTFTDLVGKYMRYYQDTFGQAPSAEMLFIASDSSYWGGEVMGRVISLSVASGGRSGFNPLAALSHVIAHEIFHMWNSGIEVEDPESGEFEWFGEGFTAEYFSYVAGLRVGDLDENVFLSQLAGHWNKYAAKFDGTIDLVSAGKEKEKNYDLVYSGAFIAAATLDFQIRHETKNEKKLDDLIPLLLKRYPRQAAESGKASAPAVSLELLRGHVESLFGKDIADALEQYIRNPELIPFQRAAALAGLEAEGSGIGKRIKLTRVAQPTSAQQKVWNGIQGNG